MLIFWKIDLGFKVTGFEGCWYFETPNGPIPDGCCEMSAKINTKVDMRLKEEKFLAWMLLDVTKNISRCHWTVLKSAVIYKISRTCYDLSLLAQFHGRTFSHCRPYSFG